MTRLRKVIVGLSLGLVTVIGILLLYTKFEYTLVSDIREGIAGADSQEGKTLGATLFGTRGCGSCHTLGKLFSGRFGPDLTKIAISATASEIKNSIVNPDGVISENCPDGPCVTGLMPNFGEILDDREIEALVVFLLESSQ